MEESVRSNPPISKLPYTDPLTPVWLGVGLDLLAIPAAMYLAIGLRSMDILQPMWNVLGASEGVSFQGANGRAETGLILLQMILLPILLSGIGQYQLHKQNRPDWSPNRVMFANFAVLGSILLALAFMVQILPIRRTVLVMDFAFLVGFQIMWRSMIARNRLKRYRRGLDLRNVLVIGTKGLEFAKHVIAHPEEGRRIVGILRISDNDLLPENIPQVNLEEAVATLVTSNKTNHLNVIELLPGELEDAFNALHPEEIIISPGQTQETKTQMLQQGILHGIDVHLLPQHLHELGIVPRAWTIGNWTLLDFHQRPMSRSGYLLKRLLDVSCALFGLALFALPIAISAIAIKIEDPKRTIFYGGNRVGLKGKTFKQWKLSTMRSDADQLRHTLTQVNAREGPWFQVDEQNDPRITPLGRFLRKWSLNELPQFWNVLIGDMSMVGPRPLAKDEVKAFLDYDAEYHRIFDVKPGFTGLWQVKARNDPSFVKRINLDFEYVDNWSIFGDAALIIATPLAMLKGGR